MGRYKGRYKRTTLITIGCLSVLAGLGLSRRISLEPQLYWMVLLPVIFLIKRKSTLSLYVIIAIGLCIGIWRGTSFMVNVYDLQSIYGQKVTIQATATSNSVYGNNYQMEFTASSVKLINPHSQNLSGSFRVSGFGEPMVYRGDRLDITGKIFPSRGSSQSRISFAQLNTITPDDSWLNGLTRRFGAGMSNALPEPQASLGMGILIGQRSNLPDYTLAALSIVGLTHIIAVSGYNLTILVRAVSRFKFFGSKFQKLVASLALIGTFLLITGFSASIVRAAAIAGLGLWAWYYGRKLRPILSLSLVAAATAVINPFYIWGDIGWYLSFLAFFGVLILAPAIGKKLFGNREPRGVVQILLETFAAYLMTLPLIMFIFGKLSVVALLANLLVIPLVPFAMLFSAVAGVAGMIIPTVSGWLAVPANLTLTYILDVAYALSKFSFAQVLTKLSLVQMVAIYGLIGALTALIITRYRSSKTP